ncbi:MAG: arabinose-5-phosphate isomerase [Zetaproteobacteria bacterium]|nr:arabinose-5-phosphate isomerase [Pseudobdellovibrionaceae bacterium]
MNYTSYLEIARKVFEIESKAISGLSKIVDENFPEAVRSILESKGRVIVCGMGKSGIIGSKIAATLASTGTPSFFMHPGEAYHGDLGMVTAEDIFLALSNSGETDEVIKLIPFLKDNKNTLISLTGNKHSTLANSSDFHISVKVETEACPLQLAPTSSTTATLAMGDALAVTLMKVRNFQPENFAKFHPGGSLGRRLLNRVENEMTAKIPVTGCKSSILELITSISRGRLGLSLVEGERVGLVTDGDIRRAVENYGESVFSIKAEEIMTLNPVTVEIGTRMEDALSLMDSLSISSLLVKDNDKIVGVVKK